MCQPHYQGWEQGYQSQLAARAGPSTHAAEVSLETEVPETPYVSFFVIQSYLELLSELGCTDIKYRACFPSRNIKDSSILFILKTKQKHQVHAALGSNDQTPSAGPVLSPLHLPSLQEDYETTATPHQQHLLLISAASGTQGRTLGRSSRPELGISHLNLGSQLN